MPFVCVHLKMSEETIKKLEERLKCAICHDTYTDPKLLQCFHVFCGDCLVQLVVQDQQGQLSLTCPNCRQATPIPANGVTGLQSAFHFNDFLEIMEELKKPKDTAASQEGNVTRPNSSKKVSPYCSVHADKELELYCETCGELICSHCALRGQKHHSHEYDLISSCYEKYKREMTPSLESMEKQLTSVKEALTDLDVCCGEISNQQEVIEAGIHRITQRLHEIIDVRNTELINQLHQKTQEKKLKGLAVQKDELETILAKLSSCLEFVRESLQTSSQGEVMKMKTTIIKKVKELTATFQPDILKPNTEADIEFIMSTDVTAMCENYGRIGVPGSPDPSQCHATGKAVVGEESTAIVQANDFKGEPCEKQVTLECELVSELTGVVVRGNVRRRGESQYEINYQPTIKGRHQLLIKIKDQHIRGSPFPVTAKMPVEKLGTPIQTIDGLNRPWGVAINRKGEMVVTEFVGDCVTVLSPSGRKIRFGTRGSGRGQFKNPLEVAVDGDGNLLVADHFNHRIQKFVDYRFFAAVGTEGEGSLQFKAPTSIAFNAANNKIYVADSGNSRIQVLNSDLTISSNFGKYGSGRGKFKHPYGVSCDSSGQIFVADTDNHRIQVFTAEGIFMRMFGQHGSGCGELNEPICIFVDADGVVYVSEGKNHRISVFTSEGRFVTSFGSKGEGPRQFDSPCGIAVDNSGVVYVCDCDNCRIQMF